MTKYAVVDLSNLISRCRHVVVGDIYTRAGMALQIIFRSLRKLRREHQIDHIVFAIDHGSWRYEVYPQYKARRKINLIAQTAIEKEEQLVFLETSKALVAFLNDKTNCTVLDCKRVEADDFVARWTQLHPDDSHVILSGDSDFVQLLAPNVAIYDGVQEHTLSLDAVIDTKGQKHEFSISKKDGKIKVGKPDPDFIAEEEWWRKALFVKLIRGDAGDGIFPAYPGVFYDGSTKRVGISEAWEDRKARGYHWNNFFQSEWKKAVEIDGSIVKLNTKVIDAYNANRALIDLTQQPDDVKDLMDEAIMAAVTKPPVRNVGIHFLRFCGQFDLPALGKESSEHSVYLNAHYKKDI